MSAEPEVETLVQLWVFKVNIITMMYSCSCLINQAAETLGWIRGHPNVSVGICNCHSQLRHPPPISQQGFATVVMTTRGAQEELVLSSETGKFSKPVFKSAPNRGLSGWQRLLRETACLMRNTESWRSLSLTSHSPRGNGDQVLPVSRVTPTSDLSSSSAVAVSTLG